MAGNIYFIACRETRDRYFTRFVKVGFAVDVEKRLMELQIGNPFRLQVVTVYPDAEPVLEKVFHGAMERFRVRGEWFRYSRQVRYMVKLIANGARPTTAQEIDYLLTIGKDIDKARKKNRKRRHPEANGDSA